MLRTILIAGVVLVSSPARATNAENAGVLDVLRAQTTGYQREITHRVKPSQEHVRRVVVQEARRQGVPERVAIAVAHTESRLNARAVGPRTRWGHAYGVMQVLHGTAQLVRPGTTTQELLTAEVGAAVGVAYLRQRFDATGSWEQAVKEYHGGPDRRLHGPKTLSYQRVVLAHAGLRVPDVGARGNYEVRVARREDIIIDRGQA